MLTWSGCVWFIKRPTWSLWDRGQFQSAMPNQRRSIRLNFKTYPRLRTQAIRVSQHVRHYTLLWDPYNLVMPWINLEFTFRFRLEIRNSRMEFDVGILNNEKGQNGWKGVLKALPKLLDKLESVSNALQTVWPMKLHLRSRLSNASWQKMKRSPSST
jgi:hypothetical protein